MRKYFPYLTSIILCLCSCNGYTPKNIVDYTKTSKELLKFQSSDSNLDFFLNDYFKRHVGLIDEKGEDFAVNTLRAGSTTTNMFYQEWTSLALSWFNSYDGLETDRLEGQRNRISSIPVDDYGYVWDDNDNVRENNAEINDGMHSMGWPFPTSANSDDCSTSWIFNSTDEPSWTSNFNAKLNYSSSTDGLFYGHSNSTSSFEMTSNLLSNRKSIVPYYAPYIELDLRMYLANPEDVDDVYLYFKTSREGEFSNDKCLKASEVCALNYDFDAHYEHLLNFPVYAHESWTDNDSLYEGIHIYQLKVVVKAKEGKTLRGDVGLNSVRCNYDTRHVNNNGLFVTALKNDFTFTGNVSYLKTNITRARKAVNFYMQMFDKNRNLVRSSYQVGHDGDKNPNSTKSQKLSHCLGNGYYDVLYNCEYDFQTNLYFYKAVKDLAFLEKVLENNQIVISKDLAQIKTADRNNGYGTSSYTYSANDLENIANKVLEALRANKNDQSMEGFYNPETGRFGAGYDVNTGNFYDYGYTMWNTEAIYLGIADKTQSKSIMDWISGKRIVEQDKKDQKGQGDGNAKTTGIGGSCGDDIYFFEFAPRINTVNKNNPSLYTGYYESGSGASSVYGYTQVQYGGAIMYTSFYDLLGRTMTYGGDDAFSRLKGIESWYKKVYDNSLLEDREWRKANGTYNSYFYYDYYAKTNLKLQGGRYGNSQVGGSSSGLLGVDSEFIESLLLIAAVPLGFFGLDSVNGKELTISPKMPSNLSYWKMENLSFNNVKYDLTIQKNGLRIDSTRGNAEGLTLDINIPLLESGVHEVYVNGKLTNDYQIVNNAVKLNLNFKNCTVEIR